MTVSFLDIVTSLVLALIMLGIGISLTVRNFNTIFIRPRVLLIGLSLQMFLLPALAFLLCWFFDLSPEFKVGIIILASCPGGTTSNLTTYLLNCNTALAIVLTVINSFLTLISIPLIVQTALSFFMKDSIVIELPVMSTVLHVFFIVILPVFVGVSIRERLPNISDNLSRVHSFRLFNTYSIKFNILKSVTVILLGIVFSIKIFGSKAVGGTGLEISDFKELLPIGILLNILGLVISYFIPLLLRYKSRTSVTISMQVGLQNTTLAFLIAASILNNSEMEKPALVYSFFSFWLTLGFGIIIKYFVKRKTGVDPFLIN